MKITRTFTKYANRKLYDAEKSSYVSMLDLSDVVAAGSSVSVACDLTGRDITVDVLGRALYERLKDRDPAASDLSQSDLERLIRKISRRKVSE